MKGYPFGRGLWAPCLLFVALTLCLCGGCATLSEEGAERRMDAHMARCSARHGYDPAAVTGVGEHELAPGEREWRACVYQGIRTLIIPQTAIPQVYENLIAQDTEMTDAIERGTLTRSQRKARIDNLVRVIRQREGAERSRQVKALKESREISEDYSRQMEVQEDLMRGLGR